MDDRVPVLCTLAKHHVGDHDARGTPARHACRKVIRYEPAPLAPAAVPPDSGEATKATEHNHFGEIYCPESCPACAAMAKEGPPLPASPPLGGLAGCDGHDHGSLTKCVPPCPAFDHPLSTGPTCAVRGGIVTAWLGDAPPGWKPGMRPPCIACGAESGEECRKAAPPEPSTQDLISEVIDRDESFGALTVEANNANREAHKALEALARARSALAKHVGNGRLVLVGGATFKAIAPRKPKGGELAADALWRLEPVEVAK